MITHDRLKQFVTQIADQSQEMGDPTSLFADDDNETLILWHTSGVVTKLFLEDGGKRLTVYTDLGEVAEERRDDVFEYLLELNFAWRSLPMTLAASEHRPLLVIQCQTEDLDAEALRAVLSELSKVAVALLPLILGNEDLGIIQADLVPEGATSHDELAASGALRV